MKTSTIVKLSVLGFLGLAAIGTVANNAYTVDEGDRYVVLRLGKIDRVQEPGLRFKVPFIEDKHRMSVRVLPGDFTGLTAYTADNQIVTFDLLVPYQFQEGALSNIYITYGTTAKNGLMRKTIEGALKEEVGQVNTITLASKREQIAIAVGERVSRNLTNFGVTVLPNQVKLSNVDYDPVFDEQVKQAMIEKAQVEQMRQSARKAEQDAERKRFDALGEANRLREIADGQAYSITEVAKAEAAAIELKGQAEAERLRVRGQALADNPQLADLLYAEAALQWDGKLPDKFIPGSALPLLNLPGFSSAE